jgi:hypothetical protein
MCLTNHAVDQFLDDLLLVGIPESDLIRLGGRASERLLHLTLPNQPRAVPLESYDWGTINGLKTSLSDATEGLAEAYDGYRWCRSLEATLDHLKNAHPEYYEAFKIPTAAAGFMEPTYLLRRWKEGLDAGALALQHPDVPEASAIWQTSHEVRHRTIAQWEDDTLRTHVDMVHEKAAEYKALQLSIEKIYDQNILEIIKSKRIIACTTTGAAKYRAEVAAAEPRVLIVEEAGEISESHILTALTPQIEQMILIGDHK